MSKSLNVGSRRLGASGWVLASSLLLGAVPILDAGAGGFSISILGGRRTGMQAMLAAPDDETALFHNPAGLGELPGTRFHLSGSTTFFSADFQLRPLDPARFPEINPKNCGTAGNAACPWPTGPDGYYNRPVQPESYFGVLPYLGFSQDLGAIGPKWKDVVVSAALTAPNLYGANLPLNAPTAYNFVKGYFAVISLIAGAGWKVNDKFSVGFGFSYNYMRLTYSQRLSLTDSLRGRNPTPADIATADAAQGLLGDALLDYTGSDSGVGWNFGVLYHPLSWLHFGLSYNGATSASFNGGVTVKELVPNSFTNLAALATSQGLKLPYALNVVMPIPHSVQAGVMFKLSPKVELALDYRAWLYNFYSEQTIVPIYDETTPGREPLTRADLSKRKDYKLSYEISMGVLVRPWTSIPGLELMAGVGYDESPVASKYLSLDNPSLNQLVFTLGARWQINPRWRLSGSYMGTAHLERVIDNSALNPPINMRGKALAHIPRIEIEYMR